VFKETPSGQLIETNRHARLFCPKELLIDVIFIHFSDKKLFTLATPKQESPAVADKPARRLLKVCTVYKSSEVVSCIASLPIDSVPIVSY